MPRLRRLPNEAPTSIDVRRAMTVFAARAAVRDVAELIAKELWKNAGYTEPLTIQVSVRASDDGRPGYCRGGQSRSPES
jgi:hypothetical protein